MVSLTGKVMVVKNSLPQASAQVRAAVAQEVERTARAIAAGAAIRTPPRVDSGALIASWAAERISDTVWGAYSDQEHSIYNEFGTWKMSAHPMIRPSATEEFPRLLSALSQRLRGIT